MQRFQFQAKFPLRFRLFLIGRNNTYCLYYRGQSNHFFSTCSDSSFKQDSSKAFNTYVLCLSFTYRGNKKKYFRFVIEDNFTMYLLGVFTYFCFFSSSVAAPPVSSRIHPRPSTGRCCPCFSFFWLIEGNNSYFLFFLTGKYHFFPFCYRGQFYLFWVFTYICLFLIFSCSTSSFKQNSSKAFNRYELSLSFTYWDQ